MTQAFHVDRSAFPEGFQFGVATSSYQIEGTRFGGCGPSHWDSFAATPGNVTRAENGATACAHYERWAEDLDLVAGAGLDAYRFSTSWARVQPEGAGAPNPDGLDFYERIVDGCLARGLKPTACLYHWDLPAALADCGGWRNRDIADRFADYAEIVMRRIGDRLFAAATFNEPWCVGWLSHFLGHHAPGLRDIRATARASHFICLAHARATDAMRALGLGNLGVILNFEYAQPVDDAPASQAAAALYDDIYNQWYASAMFGGAYPEAVLQGFEAHMPKGWERDMATIAPKLDWLGVNYYTRKMIAADPEAAWPRLQEVDGPLPKTQMGWEIYPDGLRHFLEMTHSRHTKGLPLYVTENGMASPDALVDGAVSDPQRIAFLNAHFAAARAAVDAGVPVRGYHVWSLLDNYEWALGYEKRFGLVHVDFETLERTPKASYHALRAALAR